MRILSILWYSPPSLIYGGAERQMHSLHKGLISRGVDVQVLADISHVRAPYQKFEAVPVWGTSFPRLTCSVFHPWNIKFWVDLQIMLRLIKNKIGPVDLIQLTPLREPALYAHWLSKHLKTPWVARIACSGSYGDFHYMSGNWLTKRLLPELVDSCSTAVVLDDETRREALKNGFPEEKIVLISNSLVLEEFPSTEDVQRIPERGVILYVGRIAIQKRVDSLVKAYGACKFLSMRTRKWTLPPLNLIGGGDNDSLRKIAQQCGVENDVHFHGHQPNPERFFPNAVCFVNPSESEGFPNAVLEACAFGVPVILSDIPVHRDIAADVGMEDFVFPVGDEKGLSEKLLAFLNLTREQMMSKRIRCAEYAQGRSCQFRNNAYLALYEKVLNRNKV